jgi:hypothetical protein
LQGPFLPSVSIPHTSSPKLESAKRRNSSMSGEGRSPKRQRLDSYSPASPPIIADPLKHSENSQPQTPPPSVRMSPSWSQPGQMLPGLGMQGQTSPNAGATQSFQSQPLSNGGSSTAEGEQQTQTETPATTVGDAEMRDSGGDTQMTDADNRRTDHERKEGSGGGVLYKVFTERKYRAHYPSAVLCEAC